MRQRPARRSRLGNMGVDTQVFLPILIRDAYDNPVVNKAFWLDRKRAPGGSKIPEYSGKYTTDANGRLVNTFSWDGSVPVSATISITPLFSSEGAPANKAIVWQQPATWYGSGGEIANTVVYLRPGGKSNVPTPATPSAPSNSPSAPGSSLDPGIDYWMYVKWGSLGLLVLAVTYFYVLPSVLGEKGER